MTWLRDQNQGFEMSALDVLVTITAGFFGALLGVLIFVLWPTESSSYDECVLAEMEGRQQVMLRFATRVCRERFPEGDPYNVPPDELKQ